eukprot:14098967-Alexandrium_andersonii.AAC.1
MNSAALLRDAGCHRQEKIMAIQEAVDSILTMENEFEIFVQTNIADIWQLTLRVEYGPTTRGR